MPCGHLREAQSDPEESTETSGGRGQRPPRRLRLRTCDPPSFPKGFFDSLKAPAGRQGPQTVDKSESTVVFYKEKRISMSNI